MVASWLMRIPSVLLADYEYANPVFGDIFSTKILMPDKFNKSRLKEAGIKIDKVDFYPGIKEQIYIKTNLKKENVLKSFGIDKSKIIIIFRPPSITAHYHNPQSETIMREIFKKISQYKENVFLVLLPRTKEQGKKISNFLSFESIPHIIPKKPLDGINLILNSDLVLSGGGTMTREAAVLGVPSYSFFKGPKGAVDEFLEKNNRLIFIDSTSNIKNIQIKKRQKELNILEGNQEEIISSICDQLESFI